MIDEFTIIQQSTETLLFLKKCGEQTQADSVMVLTNATEADVMMSVFEPHAYQAEVFGSGWSTMCGNGIRAVAQYLQDTGMVKNLYHIKTGAGVQRVLRGNHIDEWTVDMGYYYHDAAYFPHYVSRLNTLRYPQLVVGLHSQQLSSPIDGEPHAVIFLDQSLQSSEATQLAASRGALITHDRVTFPQEINVSVVSQPVLYEEAKTVQVVAATYERNIYYVTQACGTAATVIGSHLLQHYTLTTDWRVTVQMPGGLLDITHDQTGRYYLTGTVQRVS